MWYLAKAEPLGERSENQLRITNYPNHKFPNENVCRFYLQKTPLPILMNLNALMFQKENNKISPSGVKDMKKKACVALSGGMVYGSTTTLSRATLFVLRASTMYKPGG